MVIVALHGALLPVPVNTAVTLPAAGVLEKLALTANAVEPPVLDAVGALMVGAVVVTAMVNVGEFEVTTAPPDVVYLIE
jgi:hypothetical protein